jgi:hypothetical protein
VTQIFLKSLSKQLKQYYKNLIFDKKEHFFGVQSGDLLVNLISIIAKNYILYLIAPDILYLIKKAEKESHHYMNQTNKKYYD